MLLTAMHAWLRDWIALWRMMSARETCRIWCAVARHRHRPLVMALRLRRVSLLLRFVVLLASLHRRPLHLPLLCSRRLRLRPHQLPSALLLVPTHAHSTLRAIPRLHAWLL